MDMTRNESSDSLSEVGPEGGKRSINERRISLTNGSSLDEEPLADMDAIASGTKSAQSEVTTNPSADAGGGGE